jgi:uncharacterized SAM-binding protein YcdF (DUF218 family)
MKGLVEFIITPSNAILLLAIAGFLLMQIGWLKWARRALAVSLSAWLLFGYTSAGELLHAPLDSRFPPLDLEAADPPFGIIVLGGHLLEVHAAAMGTPVEFRDGAETVPTAALLAQRYPQAKLILSGGHGGGFPPAPMRTVDGMKRIVEAFGIAPERITIEGASRNTAERVRFTLDIVGADRDRVWWVVTGAARMPRVMGTYRQAGFEPVPMPVDYRWIPPFDPFWTYALTDGLAMTDDAVHEWLGLFVYWWTGRSNALFPGPRQT